MSDKGHHHIRTLGVRDMTLFTVSAILLLDTLSASASIGVSSITWWTILGILYFVPYGMISAELGTTYPEQGGIYAWVRDAFGPRWGSRVTWFYWLNNTLWQASVFVMFSGIFAQMFIPEMTLTGKLVLALAMNWIVIILTCVSLSVGKWIPNVGAVVKMIAFAALVAGGVAYASRGGVRLANDFSLASFVPEWGSAMQYVSVIIYGMLGFELMCSASEEMKNPTRDVPRSILASGVIIWLAYVLGTFAILAAVPVADINLVEGLVDTFRQLFGDTPAGSALALVIGALVLATFFSNTVTWSIGSNRASAEAANDGELPRIFAYEHPRNGTPVGSAILMGAGASVLLLAYGFLAGSNEDLFWSLFASSAVIFLLPYVGAVAAFLYARIHDAERPRPYRVPGGMPVAKLMTAVCIALLGMSILLFMYVPGEGFDLQVVTGVVVSVALGEVAIFVAEHEKRTRRHAA